MPYVQVSADAPGQLLQKRHEPGGCPLQLEGMTAHPHHLAAFDTRHFCIHPADVPPDYHPRCRPDKNSVMRIIGVIDVSRGRAVHARGGRRAAYAAVTRVAATPVTAGDPIAVARAYRERFAVDELYVADLDAIDGKAPQSALIRAVAGVSRVWVDAGVTSVAGARAVLASGASRVVVGL